MEMEKELLPICRECEYRKQRAIYRDYNPNYCDDCRKVWQNKAPHIRRMDNFGGYKRNDRQTKTIEY